MRLLKQFFVLLCACVLGCAIVLFSTSYSSAGKGVHYNGFYYMPYKEARLMYADGIIKQKPVILVNFFVKAKNDKEMEEKVKNIVDIDIPDTDMGFSMLGDSAECNVEHRSFSYVYFVNEDNYYVHAQYFLKYRMSGDRRLESKVKAHMVATEIRSMTNLTRAEQLLAACRYISNNCDYNSKNLKDARIFTMGGVLLEGEAVCQGYAEAFYMICRELNIPCRIILGYAGSGNEDISDWEYHAWNIVKLGDKWYCCDPTWAASSFVNSIDVYSTGFFLKGTDSFYLTHKVDDEAISKDFFESHPLSEEDYVYPNTSISKSFLISSFK